MDIPRPVQTLPPAPLGSFLRALRSGPQPLLFLPMPRSTPFPHLCLLGKPRKDPLWEGAQAAQLRGCRSRLVNAAASSWVWSLRGAVPLHFSPTSLHLGSPRPHAALLHSEPLIRVWERTGTARCTEAYSWPPFAPSGVIPDLTLLAPAPTPSETARRPRPAPPPLIPSAGSGELGCGPAPEPPQGRGASPALRVGWAWPSHTGAGPGAGPARVGPHWLPRARRPGLSARWRRRRLRRLVLRGPARPAHGRTG